MAEGPDLSLLAREMSDLVALLSQRQLFFFRLRPWLLLG